MEYEELAVNVCRINNFLVNNQLVQANAICQRLESALQADFMTSNEVEAEKHESFILFKKVHMTRTYVVAGNRDAALSLIREVATMLPTPDREEPAKEEDGEGDGK